MDNQNKPKMIALVGTILFHTILLLAMLNIFLERIVPQDEEGLEVALGMDVEGGNDLFQPTPASEVAAELDAVTPPEVPNAGEEALQTQNIEESVSMPEVKKEKTPEEIKREKDLAEKKRIERQKQLEEQRKIAEEQRKKAQEQRRVDSIRNAIARQTSGLRGNGNGGVGTDSNSKGTGGGNGSGTKGNPFGNPNSSNTEGASSGGGNSSYSLAGRSVVGNMVKPVYNANEEGKIIVNIIVNKDGTVIEATIGSGTQITDPALRKEAVNAAKKTKFNGIKTNGNQKGSITYKFQMR